MPSFLRMYLPSELIQLRPNRRANTPIAPQPRIMNISQAMNDGFSENTGGSGQTGARRI